MTKENLGNVFEAVEMDDPLFRRVRVVDSTLVERNDEPIFLDLRMLPFLEL